MRVRARHERMGGRTSSSNWSNAPRRPRKKPCWRAAGLRTILDLLFHVAKARSSVRANAGGDRGGPTPQDGAGAEAAATSPAGCSVSHGRKAYQRWPSRKPVWTLSAFSGGVILRSRERGAVRGTGRSSSGSICRCTRRPGYTGCSEGADAVQPHRRRDRERAQRLALAARSKGARTNGETVYVLTEEGRRLAWCAWWG